MSMTQEKVVPLTLSENTDTIVNGTVTAVSADTATVSIAGMHVTAKKAFSCFVNPAPADTVICCRDESGRFYILGIMERNAAAPTKISYPPDTEIASRNGSIRFVSAKSMTMASENLNFVSGEAVHKSRTATISFTDMTATGNNLRASYKTVSVISNLINTMARQVIARFKGYIRQTEDNDEVKAGQSTRTVKGLYSLNSRHTVMVSKESTKIDGEKILMG